MSLFGHARSGYFDKCRTRPRLRLVKMQLVTAAVRSRGVKMHSRLSFTVRTDRTTPAHSTHDKPKH